jgi:serine/threonine protein kinase/Tol biopolymer transport system component
MTLAAGTRLGVYEVIAPLGTGGMGEVYRARDTRLKRDVALKILPASLASDPERLARFQREAEVLASLDHPHIGAIYGLEESNGTTALVLQLVEGDTLADRIVRGQLPLDEALPIARQIAEALEAAHEQGVIHRDLKPANVKITPDGVVKVLDFGLAKLIEPGSGIRPSTIARAVPSKVEGQDSGSEIPLQSQSPTITTPALMTGVGTLLGTAAYMSPEQAKGRPADKRSDVWAFGCVLYEMLTGRRAFEGEDVADTLAAVLRGEPDWNALPARTPTAIGLLLRRCLERDRKRRAGDMAAALLVIGERDLIGPDSGRTIVESRLPLWRRTLPVTLASLVVAAVTSFIWWNLTPPVRPLGVTRFAFALPEGDALTDPQLASIAISPDGTQIAYVANRRLYLRPMAEGAPRPIPGTDHTSEQLGYPMFSPDGESIAFWSGTAGGGVLKRIAVSGGAPVTICQTGRFYGATWGPDGIVFGEPNVGIMRVSSNGGKPELIVSIKDDEVVQRPSLLPGGEAVLFTVVGGAAGGQPNVFNAWADARIVAQSLRSGDRKILVEGGNDARYLPTGHILYALGGVVFAVPVNPQKLEVTGGAVPVLEGVMRTAIATLATGSVQLGVSTTGSLAYLAGQASTFPEARSSLALVERSGTTTLLKLPPGFYERPRVSPDARQVAYSTDDGMSSIVWIYDLSGARAPRQLTFEGKRNRFPVWSPDGQFIAFQSDSEGDAAIFTQRSDGSSRPQRLTKPDSEMEHAPESWSRDGKQLLFTGLKKSDNSLWVLSLEGGNVSSFADVHSPRLISPSFSPDGKWVVYTETTEGSSQSLMQPFPPTGAKYLIGVGSRPQWSADGKEIFLMLTPRSFSVSVTMQPSVSVGNPVALPFNVYGGRGPGFGRDTDVMPDGRRFVTVVPSTTSEPAAPRNEIEVVLNWFEELKRLVPQ